MTAQDDARERQPRERAVVCIWCGRFTWNLHPVCDSETCQDNEARYQARRAS